MIFSKFFNYKKTEWMIAKELIKKGILEPGDMIEIKRLGYRHWAIFEGDDKDNDTIIHFTGETSSKKGGKAVVVGSLIDAAGDSYVRINNSRDPKHVYIFKKTLDTSDVILQRARDRLTVFNKTTKTFDPLDDEYIIDSDKCHKTKVTFSVDNKQLLSIKQETIILSEIENLPKKLNEKDTEKIPIIGFFDDSSVICLWNEKKSCYEFSKLWNGKYGKNLILDFSYKKPKLVDSSNPTSTYVVYDILKIMSFSPKEIKEKSTYENFKITKDDENPVLLEFDSFENTRKAASPAFLMALLLKQHRKAIRKEIGEKPMKLGFCIFDKSSRPEAGKCAEEGLAEACRMLKVDFMMIENQLKSNVKFVKKFLLLFDYCV